MAPDDDEDSEDLYDDEFDFVDDDEVDAEDDDESDLDDDSDADDSDADEGEEGDDGVDSELEEKPAPIAATTNHDGYDDRAIDEEPLGDEDDKVDEYGRPEPAANYRVHVYEYEEFKRTIDRPFTAEDAEAFASEYNRTSKSYSRFAVTGKEDVKPKKLLTAKSRVSRRRAPNSSFQRRQSVPRRRGTRHAPGSSIGTSSAATSVRPTHPTRNVPA